MLFKRSKNNEMIFKIAKAYDCNVIGYDRDVKYLLLTTPH